MATLPSSPIPLRASRALALHTQLLDKPPADGRADEDDIYDTVRSLGWVQIDTLHMVARSQYLVMWSRVGQYDPADFDALIFDPEKRRLFEYWKKAACIIPLEDFRYSLPRMMAREDGSNSNAGWRRWLAEEANQQILAQVRQRIRQDGGMRTADFEYEGPKRGSWWDWKPAKNALEHLFNTGELMISERVNFHRVYDLRERVLPDWVDTTPATLDEANCYDVAQAVKALGICEPYQTAQYAYMGLTTARKAVASLLKQDVLVEVEGEIVSGETKPMVVHRDRLPDLQRALDGELQPRHTTFLSPFDSLFWAHDREEKLWNFRSMIEMYKREPDRIYGYFSLYIVHHDRLVGRFDPKLDRKTGTLHLRALHLEPDIKPDDTLVTDFVGALRDFMAFHDATALVIEDKGHADFRKKVLKRF